MERRRRAVIPRSEDPLGFGLKSIAEPLQRLWLIRKGNPYFDDDIRLSRTKLGIPIAGFADAREYTNWFALRWPRHGHDKPHIAFLIADGVPLRDDESMARYFLRDLTWPLEDPAPSPCCETDPLYLTALALLQRYGVDPAEAEPGFRGLDRDVVGYLVANQWPPRRALPPMEVIYEKDILIDPATGRRLRESYVRRDIGLPSRAGQGGELPVWYEGWRQQRDGASPGDIVDWIEEEYGTWYDEHSVRRAVAGVERLMLPVTN